MSNNSLKEDALNYHAEPRPGKIATEITKPTTTQRDLSLAYTPGVAEPVREIHKDPENAYKYTGKGNLVAVISDGSAVLGLGNVGALAGKPVMEGKGVLFKRFADVDVFDIEVSTQDVEEFITVVKNIAISFGGINLEDISAPRCFEIERRLQEMLDIPVFHDDQHGTATIIAAGLMNALELQGKKIEDVNIVCVGAGAAGVASMNLLTALGANKQKLLMVDSKGVLSTSRTDLNSFKQQYAVETDKKTLADACNGADVFIGVSGPNILTVDMLKTMAAKPIVFALSNPDPEIAPAAALAARDDLVMATGRSDYPNQINNVLGFPFLFRGALDVRARCINSDMLKAAVMALAELAREPVPADVLAAYGLEKLEFGKDYIIPKPFDKRLRERVPKAVAQAAIDSGVARLPMPY
ncbi:MAG: malic enzyme-like NAD(P)-binding protein [Thiotrichaceae bacterium]|jgi:malate dehydrogenase (oxaloacetate-decarboxylating)(NADP+)|uniref:NADP-dependent malic enzyme n=1 Tax=Candidatus Thiocaldithrix dubininis TaxID=3080823 RepID=A0AA95H484_9GAMM|nr:MAG: malic enzyme-like NAD(P)-binding protein [Candidatus Thiocaldithrix dubininis]